MTCALCQLALDENDPDFLIGYNPQTFRRARMHSDCYREAAEDLRDTPDPSPQFASRYDRYLEFLSEAPSLLV